MSTPAPPARERDPSGNRALPRSIFVPELDPLRVPREAVDAILNDRLMAFLSILIIPIILLPLLVSLPTLVQGYLDTADYVVIAFFVVEYVAKLSLAADRRRHFLDPWHLLDLAVVVLSVGSYLPFLGLQRFGSAALLVRLLRLARVVAIGGRTTGRKVQGEEASVAPPAPTRPLSILQVDAQHPSRFDSLSWQELELHLPSSSEEWLDLSNVDDEGIARLSKLLELQSHQVRFRQVDELYPHVGQSSRGAMVFLQSGEVRYPERPEEAFSIANRGLVVIVVGPKVVTLSPHGLGLPAKALARLQGTLSGRSFGLAALLAILEASLEEYRAIFSEIELEAGQIISAPRSKLPRDFLARMYQIQKVALRLSSNLVHFRELLSRMGSGRIRVSGLDDRTKEDFDALSDETSFLGQVADDVTDNLETIINLYINQSSFETNRVLKILAVVATLAIIPAVVGGLLGVNPPFSSNLLGLFLFIVLSMSFVAYSFAKLGWLRS